jgi:hypothetical protein
MTHDDWLTAGLVLAFASFATAHVALVLALAARPPRWRAAAAAVVPPLAPYWGVREKMALRTGLWLASALAYTVVRWLASR